MREVERYIEMYSSIAPSGCELTAPRFSIPVSIRELSDRRQVLMNQISDIEGYRTPEEIIEEERARLRSAKQEVRRLELERDSYCPQHPKQWYNKMLGALYNIITELEDKEKEREDASRCDCCGQLP